MAENVITEKEFSEAPQRVSEWRRFWRVFLRRRIVIFGLVVFALLTISAVFANVIAPYNPYVGIMADSLQQPNAKHLLGTDIEGRDTLSRIIFGARTVFEEGFITVIISAVIGFALGMIAGYFEGPIGVIVLRVMDALMSFPMLILASLLAAVLGAGLQNVIIALTVASIPGNARVMNGLVLTTKQNDYILAGRSMGTSNLRIMLGHILPNSLPPMIVLITLQLGGIIMAGRPHVHAAANPGLLQGQASSPGTGASLSEEMALLARAAEQLERKEVGTAISALDEHKRRFARSQLKEEREGLLVMAHCLQGSSTARGEARAFIAHAPGSVLLVRLERLCEL